jgi:hypothetical protein
VLEASCPSVHTEFSDPDEVDYREISYWGFLIKSVGFFRFWLKCDIITDTTGKGKVKVKFVLVEARKAQRGSRGIALLFL